MHWSWSFWPANLFGLRVNSDYMEFTVLRNHGLPSKDILPRNHVKGRHKSCSAKESLSVVWTIDLLEFRSKLGARKAEAFSSFFVAAPWLADTIHRCMYTGYPLLDWEMHVFISHDQPTSHVFMLNNVSLFSKFREIFEIVNSKLKSFFHQIIYMKSCKQTRCNRR